MTCNNNCYAPMPPRDWSRVQNNCSLTDDTQNTSKLVKLPYSGKIVPASILYLEYAMLNKGNVLQYKKNSSNLTKQQRYAQIAKGLWTNRNTTWATQSTRGYTNPNNQSLQRVNNINITLAGVPTFKPVTCPKPVIPVNDALPPASSGGSENPEVLPPPPPPPTGNSGTVLPATVPEPPIEPVVIQDLGNLVCGTQENVCTGELIRQPTDIICHPTSDSDVPGSLMELCWNDGTPTWYPRQRYVMTNSGDKWPTNATLLSAVKPLPPNIMSITNVENVVTIIWTFDAKCLPVNDFIIYEDGFPNQIVSSNIRRISITVDNCTTHSFYIVGSNGNIVSDPSNSVSIDIFIPLAPTITSIISTCNSGITINWETLFIQCFPVDYYTIYQNNMFLADHITSPYTITPPISCSPHSYYITTTFTNGDVSIHSNTVTTDIFPCSIQDLSISLLKDTCLTLTWTNPSSSCTVLHYDLYKNNVFFATNVTSPYLVTGLTSSMLYSFYIVSVGSPNTTQSNTVAATTYSNAPTNLTVTPSCITGTVVLAWTAPINTCSTVVSYNIYNNFISPINTLDTTLSYSIAGTNLTCGSNSFYVEAVFTDASLSLPSNIVTTTLTPCPPTISLVSTTSTTATISWLTPSTKCHIVSYNIYQNGSFVGNSVGLTYIATGLIEGQTYTFYVESVGNSVSSVQSNTLTVKLYSTPVIQSITIVCYKTATISWTNVDNADVMYYMFSQIGTPTITNLNIGNYLSYATTNLINGNSYTFSITAVYPGGILKTATSGSYSQPATSTYFTGSGYTPFDDETNTTFTFVNNGDLTYNCPTAINNVPVLVVGGGGGGGGGSYVYSMSIPTNLNGGGGGGGGEVISTTITIPNGSLYVTIGTNVIIDGKGGTGGSSGPGTNGNPGILSQITGTVNISADPGFGGSISYSSGGAGGAGGDGGGSVSTEGGDGGHGNVQNGFPSSYWSSTTLLYSGGGGGGNDAFTGGLGGNGAGGIGGGNNIIDGQAGQAYGSGGGGGGGSDLASIIALAGNGGAGRQGIVIFTIPN